MHQVRRQPIRLRRIAGSAFARVLARGLTLLLVFGNLAALPGSAQGHIAHSPGPSMPAHEHCKATATLASDSKPVLPHGRNCPMCAGEGACACLNVCVAALTTDLLVLLQIKPAQTAPTSDSAPIEWMAAPRLRPPIA